MWYLTLIMDFGAARRKISYQARRVARKGRSYVATARLCCERYALTAWGQRVSRTGGRILCYHSIDQLPGDVNDVAAARFRRQLKLALDSGYRFIRASELAAGGGGPKDLAVTFDDGLRSAGTIAAPVLDELGIPWSLFVVAGWSEHGEAWQRERFLGWREIEALAARGVEIGSHSMTHPNFAEFEDDRARIVDELGRSRRIIQDRLGIPTPTFAVPFGQSKNWPDLAASVAAEVGYTTVYAQAEQTRPRGTVARTFVTRFDNDRVFRALLAGAFDRWEEWF